MLGLTGLAGMCLCTVASTILVHQKAENKGKGLGRIPVSSEIAAIITSQVREESCSSTGTCDPSCSTSSERCGAGPGRKCHLCCMYILFGFPARPFSQYVGSKVVLPQLLLALLGSCDITGATLHVTLQGPATVTSRDFKNANMSNFVSTHYSLSAHSL